MLKKMVVAVLSAVILLTSMESLSFAQPKNSADQISTPVDFTTTNSSQFEIEPAAILIPDKFSLTSSRRTESNQKHEGVRC